MLAACLASDFLNLVALLFKNNLARNVIVVLLFSVINYVDLPIHFNYNFNGLNTKSSQHLNPNERRRGGLLCWLVHSWLGPRKPGNGV
jgi:hypothetical protein